MLIVLIFHILLFGCLDDKIAAMERDLKTLSEKLETMKAKKEKSSKQPSTSKSVQEKPPKSKSSSSASKSSSKTHEHKASSSKRSRPVYASSDEDDDVPTITLKQKQELSENISRLEGEKLAKVIQIIHRSMPQLRDVSFLSIDYNFLVNVDISGPIFSRGYLQLFFSTMIEWWSGRD